MGIFKDVMNNIDKEKIESKDDSLPEGISFLDKNLSRVILSATDDGLFKIISLKRDADSYLKQELVFDKEHLFFIGKAMSEFLKTGNIDKLKKKVEKF